MIACRSDLKIERGRLLQGQELNVFSEKTNHPLWRIVRKSVAQAFQANNMRCYNLPTSLASRVRVTTCAYLVSCSGR